MNENDYREALLREQKRAAQEKNVADLANKANMYRISKEYEASKGGGHGGAVAGVVIMIVLGIAAWMYFG